MNGFGDGLAEDILSVKKGRATDTMEIRVTDSSQKWEDVYDVWEQRWRMQW